MFNIDDCIALITSKSAKILEESLEKRLSQDNITRTQWFALYYVNNYSHISQRQLADKLVIKEPTVVRLIDKMELKGWIKRQSGKDDKRIKTLVLTEIGSKLEAEMRIIVEEFKEDAISAISEKDLKVFKNVLDQMVSNVEG